MSDPNGALATQRKSDFAVFDGAQWQSSNRGENILPGGSTSSGTVWLSEGNSTVPVTSNTQSTLVVTRYSAMTAANSANAGAITAINIDHGTLTQAVGVHAEAEQTNTGDACATYSAATIMSTASIASSHHPTAYGVFGNGGSLLPDGRAIGVNAITQVNSSKTFLGDSGTEVTSGVFVQTGAVNSQTATVTFTAASPGVVNWTAHGFIAGNSVVFTNSGGALPAALTSGTIYFVKTVTGSGTFTVSATLGGVAINFAGAGTPTSTGTAYVLSGAAVLVESTNSTFAQFDVGLGFFADSVKNTGIDMTQLVLSDSYVKMQTNFSIGLSGGTNPLILTDSGDGYIYGRSNNSHGFFVNNAFTLQVSTGFMSFTGLPNANPGPGFNLFWYDPADFNRVYFAP